MTATTDLIDAFLTDTSSQSLIDADRVRDLLLDLRLLLAAQYTYEDGLIDGAASG